MKVLGKRLKWLRNKNRYGQKDIADMIGMTASGYQKIENSERDPKLDVLIKLCDIFNVSADFLLGRENFTNEMNELSFEIKSIENQIEKFNHESAALNLKIHQLREKLLEIAKDLGFENETTILVSKKLDAYIEQNAYILVKLDEMEQKHSQVTFKYIEMILSIPDSKPWDDPILTDMQPFKSSIQFDLFDKCSIHIHGYGYYGEYETVEEAEIEQKRIMKLLNG